MVRGGSSSAPTGGLTLKGVGWGWGGGWTVELKLNRKEENKLDSKGGGCCDPLTATPDQSLMVEIH